MLLQEEREKIQNMQRELVVFREDLHQLEKTLSRLRNDVTESQARLSEMLYENKG